MTARIIGGNLRDLSYIAANLRPEDRRELDAQVDQWTPLSLAAAALAGICYVAEHDGQPVAAFGVNRVAHRNMAIAWSWGTRRMWRAVPRITAFVREALIPDLLLDGVQRVEARAMADHAVAHRWLAQMGAQGPLPLECFGRDGEDFCLFAWTRRQYADVFQSILPPEAQNPEDHAIAERADV